MRVPLVSKPGSSRTSKTGSWRTDKRPEFFNEKCIGCKMCMLLCPENCVIARGKKTYICDYDYCKGCGVCAAVCPVSDIKMIPEDEK
jgi:pyruvate ferredoxin oxidoreductase delta subunit